MVETIERTWSRTEDEAEPGPPLPGLVLVFSGGRPDLAPLPIEREPLVIGRGRVGEVTIDDHFLSRRHASVARSGDGWVIRDLDSRNGTTLDGSRVRGEVAVTEPRVLRVGDSLFVFRKDVRPYMGAVVEQRAGVIVGPLLQQAWGAIRQAARAGNVVHITGESGSGKELAARVFHEASSRSRGPFVALNCATIPAALGERLLFGARKGAYSGADADADGHLQSADKGTLFLDEVGELDLAVQPKLLRALETREVLRLGATRPTTVDIGLVSATHRRLDELVAAGRMREDLYFRIARPEVRLPPLRERSDEIPWLIAHHLQQRELAPHVSLVEVALQLPWPGNLRELLRELAAASQQAIQAGARIVERAHLCERAGRPIAATPHAVAEPTLDRPAPKDAPRRRRPPGGPSRETIEDALRKHGGSVAATARALGVHRTQLYRWIKYHEIRLPEES